MKIEEVLQKLEDRFEIVSSDIKDDQQATVRVSKKGFLEVLAFLKHLPFEHLANIFGVDRIDEGEFEVNYNLWSYEYDLSLIVKVRISRDKPLLSTCMDLWEHAQVYEREVHEFFGIEFDGNPDLSPLFLHNWQDLPPLRKDFKTEEYSEKAFDVGTRKGER